MISCRLLLLAAVLPLRGAELSIEYPALERILSQQLFTQEGRKYIRGSQTTKCSYAYLESPKIDAEKDRLRVRARFSGRSAGDFFGSCVGLGDWFNLAITAVPYYHNGMIGFRDVRVDSLERDGFYIRRVRSAMTQSLSRDFQYHVFDDAKRILEEKRSSAPYGQQLRDFQVSQIRITPQAVVLTIDFKVIVK